MIDIITFNTKIFSICKVIYRFLHLVNLVLYITLYRIFIVVLEIYLYHPNLALCVCCGLCIILWFKWHPQEQQPWHVMIWSSAFYNIITKIFFKNFWTVDFKMLPRADFRSIEFDFQMITNHTIVHKPRGVWNSQQLIILIV